MVKRRDVVAGMAVLPLMGTAFMPLSAQEATREGDTKAK